MDNDHLRVLMVGDLIGKKACQLLYNQLKSILAEENIDVCIVNGENSYEGNGISLEIVHSLFNSGVNVISSGNHIWKKKDVDEILQANPSLLRPANYPANLPGNGYTIINIKNINIAVINLMGRYYMDPIDCPFDSVNKIIDQIQQTCPIIIIDFHAEYGPEKEALGFFLDGKVSLVAGTHTHVQTADEKILPEGTGYITDIGMVGALESIIGMNIDAPIKKYLLQTPHKYVVEKKSPFIFCGLIASIDKTSGKTLSLRRYKKQFDMP